MPDEYELKCRLCDNNRERFDSISAVKASDWTEVSAMGANKGEYLMHPAFCPGHSMTDD
jgi:hypothetical protein